MNTDQKAIRDRQKDSWNRFSAGWKKWDDVLMDFLKPVGEEMIRRMQPSRNQLVLDIASGTGEPALTIARMISEGKVVMTDLSESMLQVARENAIKQGIHNVEAMVCDVSELPFANNTFDAISCRFGFMFFPDMKGALNEMYRVLKPGGSLVASVWNGPEKNFWITAVSAAVKKNLPLPEHAPDAPGMFRCAKDGLMEELFTEAGFQHVYSDEVKGTLRCGTAENYWLLQTEVSAPFSAALHNADQTLRERIYNDVMKRVNERYPSGNVQMEASSKVISGKK